MSTSEAGTVQKIAEWLHNCCIAHVCVGGHSTQLRPISIMAVHCSACHCVASDSQRQLALHSASEAL